nr:DUF2530 domain-containing protein [Micromonospora sp. DSM 115978]
MPTPPPARPPRPEPLDPPMVPFAVGGIVVWAVVGLVLLLLRDQLAAHGHENWLGICLAGFLLGFLGLAVMLRHDANRRRRAG